ncbi:MAG: mycothiol system anti-sigma-R factor [Nakamurella sp.]
MTSGDPIDEMDTESECTAVLRDVWLFLDNEMDAVNREKVQQHLDECSPCLMEAGLDQKLKELLHRKCGGDRAPEHFRNRLVAELSSLRVIAVTSDGIEQVSVQTVTVRPRSS